MGEEWEGGKRRRMAEVPEWREGVAWRESTGLGVV